MPCIKMSTYSFLNVSIYVTNVATLPVTYQNINISSHLCELEQKSSRTNRRKTCKKAINHAKNPHVLRVVQTN